ncbi:MAG: c-type cytochrome [bacterium]
MNVAANKHLLLWSSVATLALLGYAAFRENVRQEWRRTQREYRDEHLSEEARADFRVQLRQVVAPAMKATDRCVTCHIGMAPGESPIEGDHLFDKHPNVAHDPAEFGCTVCHGGQGRATERAAAHGDVHHWPEPMIPARYADAGCGSCHTHLAVPRLDLLRAGASLVERYDCLACHKLDGRGGTLRPGGAGGMEGPDLSRSGAIAYDKDWYANHLARLANDSRDGAAETWRRSFGPIPDDDREAIAALLASRAGAPQLVESKAVFHSLGCRGCHKVAGVGGDDGPDLTRVGERDPGQLDFTHVHGEKTLANWLTEHFAAPARVVPGSLMPELGLSTKEIDALTGYMLSLRRSKTNEAPWPNDRMRSERFGEREFATDGATLYGTFCAACHGPRGEGTRFAGAPPFPAIANPDFLDIASNEFIANTVRHGRPGRRMPAWGEGEGGLRPDEIERVVQFVRALGGGVAPALAADADAAAPDRWVRGDAAIGRAQYAVSCAPCHGDKGEGKEGPALNNRVLLESASDTYLVETIRRGRRGTSMPGFERGSSVYSALSSSDIESIVAFIREWEVKP